jgi:hypothetical protein
MKRRISRPTAATRRKPATSANRPNLYAQFLLWTLRHYYAITQVPPGRWAKSEQTTKVVADMDADLERIRAGLVKNDFNRPAKRSGKPPQGFNRDVGVGS